MKIGKDKLFVRQASFISYLKEHIPPNTKSPLSGLFINIKFYQKSKSIFLYKIKNIGVSLKILKSKIILEKNFVIN